MMCGSVRYGGGGSSNRTFWTLEIDYFLEFHCANSLRERTSVRPIVQVRFGNLGLSLEFGVLSSGTSLREAIGSGLVGICGIDEDTAKTRATQRGWVLEDAGDEDTWVMKMAGE
jgi:hypothetical protein